jgi:hypothetical protein
MGALMRPCGGHKPAQFNAYIGKGDNMLSIITDMKLVLQVITDKNDVELSSEMGFNLKYIELETGENKNCFLSKGPYSEELYSKYVMNNVAVDI